SAGVPVVLLDLPGDDDRDGPARRGLERQLAARPAAFMDPDRARLIEIGNTEDHLERLASCDWVVEAIIEQVEPKRALYARLEQVLPETTIVTSNTSGIPMHQLLEGRSERFRRRFLGTHFFNPPRYLHLLELIPTSETDPRCWLQSSRSVPASWGRERSSPVTFPASSATGSASTACSRQSG